MKTYIYDRIDELAKYIYQKVDFFTSYKNNLKYKSYFYKIFDINTKVFFQLKTPTHFCQYPEIEFSFNQEILKDKTLRQLEFRQHFDNNISISVTHVGRSYMDYNDDFSPDIRFFKRIRIEKFLKKNNFSIGQIHEWFDMFFLITI